MTEASPSQILVIRLSSIGDVLLATPLVRVLRRKYPAARLRFLVKPEYADLVRLNPHLDEVLTWPVERRHGRDQAEHRPAGDREGGIGRAGGAPPDRAVGVFSRAARELAAEIRAGGPLWVVDLQASPRTLVFTRMLGARRHFSYRKGYLRRELLVRAKLDRYPRPAPSIAERYFEALRELGLQPDGQGLELILGPEAERRADELVGSAGQTEWIAIAPGARWATKRWPPEAFAAAARELASGGRSVAVVGSAADGVFTGIVARLLSAAGVATLDLAGRLSLLESAAVLRRCALLVSNDSGPLHLAAAVRTPSVALFGSTVPQFGFAPYRSPARVLGLEGLSCRPCTHLGRRACPLGHFRCMRGIAPPRVIEAGRELLSVAPAGREA